MDIGWFFFDLLLLGYVEDPSTGISFCSIEERELEIYIEVHNCFELHIKEKECDTLTV